MSAYLTVAEFSLKSVVPAAYIATVEAMQVGFVDQKLADVSRRIDSKLRKRYAAPFASPYPEQVQDWLQRIVSPLVWFKRGVDATDEGYQTVLKDGADAWAEVAEAADGQMGLYDLPLIAGGTATGISKGGPLVYSEQSPYVGFDRQVDTGRAEDCARRGSGG